MIGIDVVLAVLDVLISLGVGELRLRRAKSQAIVDCSDR